MGRVVITGAGIVSPIGTSFNGFMDAIGKKTYGINYIKNFNADSFPVRYGAEAKENGKVIESNDSADRKEIFIEKAVEELFNRNSSLIEKYKTSDRIVNLGTGIDHYNFVGYANRIKKTQNWDKFRKSSYSIVENIALKYKLNGGMSVNVAACVASTQSMGLSFRMLKNTSGKLVITGGFDSMLSPLHYMGFHKLGVLSSWSGEPEKACRPFDKKRCGLVLGEGAVAYIVQNDSEAKTDSILAEISGYSSTCDAYLVTDPEPGGRYLAQAAVNAINEAGISPDDIDCVHLHGTGTIKNELAETNAMKIIFQNKYKEVPVFSLKGQIGHLIGACGAVEILGVIYSIKEQAVPPTINFEEPDTDVPLNVIKDEPFKKRINYVLKLNSAFGGQNTAFVIRRYDA